MLGCMLVFCQNGMQPAHLHSLKIVAETAVSPDGKLVAYTLSVPRPLKDGTGSAYRQLWIYNTEKKTTSALNAGNVAISSIKWHPDGEKICFRANMGNNTEIGRASCRERV